MAEREFSPFNDYDRYLFHEGNHFYSYKMLGAHLTKDRGVSGTRFTVWAPRAKRVSVVGDFNSWDGTQHQMTRIADSGLWSLFVPRVQKGTIYKYEIEAANGQVLLKADPYAFYAEVRPKTASIVYDLAGYSWGDDQWIADKKASGGFYDKPLLIYEVHLGSWQQHGFEDFLSYRELADRLVDYVAEMGYTHVEMLPIVEHPFDGSWGYQATGYFAPTSRYGTPHDFMYLVDRFHQKGIGVILDWVPGHFCKDDHGLRTFDGTYQFEYEQETKRENRGWGTSNFDLGKPEVQSFLISNALYWMDVYHIDGLRVDAVANMLYLDYEREPGQWVPNQYGGRENLEGVSFLRKLNEVVFEKHPEVLMIAEESTEWPLVTRPTYAGGLGFNYKWNMGWMNDMLKYMETDPIHRKWHHNLITFSMMYAYSENFVLPLSHDEVVHGKKSLLDKMPGDYWQKFAGLRAFLAYWIAHPGKKLLFMGGEFGQFIEWKYRESLDWHLLDYEMHQKMHQFNRQLNRFYRVHPCLWEQDHSWEGFEWIDPHDFEQSVVSFIRKAKTPGDNLIAITNFTPVVRQNYRVGVPELANYREVFNSDQEVWGGSGQSNPGVLKAENQPWHSQKYSIEITLPPLATVFFRKEAEKGTGSVR